MDFLVQSFQQISEPKPFRQATLCTLSRWQARELHTLHRVENPLHPYHPCVVYIPTFTMKINSIKAPECHPIREGSLLITEVLGYFFSKGEHRHFVSQVVCIDTSL